MTSTLAEPKFLDRWRIFDHKVQGPDGRWRKVWDPHSGQMVITRSRARHRVASCGRRFGKSVIGGKELGSWAIFARFRAQTLKSLGKRMEYWIVGPEYTDAEKEFRVLWNTLVSLGVPFDRPGTYNDPIGGSMHISLWDGTFQVHGKSAKYPDSLVGEGLHGVILAEAAKQKMSIWPKYVRPMLSDFKGWSLHTSTPEGKNHFYDKYKKGQDPNDLEWASWRMPAWANNYVYDTPTLDKHVAIMQQIMRENPEWTPSYIVRKHKLQVNAEIAGLAGDQPIEAFNQEIAADFTEYVGKVFKDWDEEYHVGDLKFNPNWETYGACDYGYTNPNVWLLIQIGPWGEINVLKEIYKEGLTADQFADEIRRRGLNPDQLRVFYPDPADPASSKVLETKLGIRASGGTGGEKKIRINLIRQYLKRGRNDPGVADGTGWRPQLMFDRSCIMGRKEMEAYRYPDSTDKPNPSSLIYEEPLKKDDHVPEALGRFFAGHFGAKALISETSGGSRVSTMNVDSMHANQERRSRNAPKDLHYKRLGSHEPDEFQYKQLQVGFGSYDD